ncbi:hypothetical protein U473_01630 [Tepidibacillus decaturensis]|uniref:Uncharacterized protein n=2 Tax=Tepidibacillus decaturensis TaxID=1413211 RepID=A0A135L7T0_9BACI|nr:hypothetical protein U473_01630 [Tepidibacillus decaturensis]
MKNNIDAVTTLEPAARTATANGTGVDLQGFDAATVVIQVGTITDGTHTPTIEESDDNVTFTAVDAADLIGTLSNLANSTNQRVGYIGTKRYIRVVSTVSGATTGGVYGALVVRGHARKYPVV